MDRPHFLDQTANLFKTHPVVALLGPRQCGKTTLARQLAADDPNRANYFDLEDPTDLARLESPKLALEPLAGLIVIDEVQRRPELFPGGKRLGFEFKYTDSPSLSRSMDQARESLKLDELLVIYPGDKTFALHSKVRAVGLSALRESI